MSFFPREKKGTQQRALKKRQSVLQQWQPGKYQELFETPFDVERAGSRNCENLVGSVAIPLGVAGPVKIQATCLTGEYLLPLATTEGALVASVNRGLKAINEAGGVQILSRKIGMSRAPVFNCQTIENAANLALRLQEKILQKQLQKWAEETSQHLQLKELQSWQRGPLLYLRLVFNTDEAMGMNMVSVATQKIAEELEKKFSQVELVSLSSNVCVDKKTSAINQLFGRGYAIQASVKLSEKIIQTVLKTSAAEIFRVHHYKNLVGSNVAASLEQNMQVANVVTAFFLATGQDPAHVVEASQASVFMEVQGKSLLLALTANNLNLGTLGGGTWLPAQSQARSLIAQGKNLSAQELAEVLAAAILAAELSGAAALASQSLARAHQRLGQGKGQNA